MLIRSAKSTRYSAKKNRDRSMEVFRWGLNDRQTNHSRCMNETRTDFSMPSSVQSSKDAKLFSKWALSRSRLHERVVIKDYCDLVFHERVCRMFQCGRFNDWIIWYAQVDTTLFLRLSHFLSLEDASSFDWLLAMFTCILRRRITTAASRIASYFCGGGNDCRFVVNIYSVAY